MRFVHLFDDPELRSKIMATVYEAREKYASLTAQQRQVLELIIEGHPNKLIAFKLGLSQRTVENHRADIMRRTGSKSVSSLMSIYMLSG